MQNLTHFVTGAAICRYVKWQPAGLALALASHFALDAMPHFEHPDLLAPSLQSFGRWLPRAVSVLVIPVAWLLWRRANTPRGRRYAIYMIVGGLLACLPDALFPLFGHDSLPGQINALPHRVWLPAFAQAVAGSGAWPTLAVLVCLAVEVVVLVLAGWLLFRRKGTARTEVS